MVDYHGVPKSVIFRVLQTPESTAHKLIKENRPLDSAASERVVRVAEITRMAEETFGGREAATRWLKTPNLSLGREMPLSLLDTEFGAGEVRSVDRAQDRVGAHTSLYNGSAASIHPACLGGGARGSTQM